MVRIMLSVAMAVLYVAALHGSEISDIRQCMNTNLTNEVLSSFRTNSMVSVQDCVLLFVKGSVTGDLKTFLSPFSAKSRFAEFGISDLDSIPASLSSEFSTLMSSVSNCVTRVTAYSEVTNNSIVRSDITFYRQGMNYNRYETVHLGVSQTNNLWRIKEWDVDE